MQYIYEQLEDVYPQSYRYQSDQIKEVWIHCMLTVVSKDISQVSKNFV